ncbi:MAG: sulfate adenylyltransferase subunit CysN [Alphaproteobacteria bacterium]
MSDLTLQQQEAQDAIDSYLQSQEQKELVRFITCGSVDDGKSTLIGRLLYDSKTIFEDQMDTLESDSKKVGTQGGAIDFALLVDGLAAEREQGITIDVAYRFFASEKRKFIVADTPGHEQYTRNMATGASTADIAIILIDARKGVLSQTRRHSLIASMLGIRHVIVAVNKMDLIDFDQNGFNAIEADYRKFAERLDFKTIQCIPLSALDGDNMITASERTSWYDGPSIMQALDDTDITEDRTADSFRMPVQWVNRPNLDFRGFAGTIVSGAVTPGTDIIAIPSGMRSTVDRIVVHGGDLDVASTDQAVTITLKDEIDISRGDVICAADDPVDSSDQFGVHMVWMDSNALLPGRQYYAKTQNKTVSATVTDIKHKIDINTGEHQAGKTLELNEIGVCNISFDQRIAFAPYKDNRGLGSFILIDRHTNNTVGVGLLDFSLRRASNIVWQDLKVDKSARASQKHQKPAILWFTGLSGSGKSTVANLVEQKLHDLGRHTAILDGDNVRHGLNRDLGFTDADRVENIRRVAEASKLMVEAGLLTLVSFISPFRDERELARQLVADDEFIEIFINTPLEVCEQRDPKGLYKKARAGEIKNFTGIDSAYEAPENPELEVDTGSLSAEDAATQIVAYLDQLGYLNAD